MSSFDLLLARHGQSTWNAVGRWQGQADPELSAVGRSQAGALAAALAPHAVAHVWASDLHRARATGELVAARCGLDLQVEPDLREIDVGDWSGSTRAEIGARDPAGLDAYFRGVEGWTGGERYAELDARVDRVLRRLDELDGPVVLITHGGTIRSFVTGLLELDREARWRFGGTSHGAATTLVRSAHGWRVTGYNVPPAAL